MRGGDICGARCPSEHLPMKKMLDGPAPVTENLPSSREACDRYLASGLLSRDPCMLKTARDGLGMVPDAAWEEEGGWKALKVHLDGSVSWVSFDGRGTPENGEWGFGPVEVDHRSVTVSIREYGNWKTGTTKVLSEMNYLFHPRGEWMREVRNLSFPDGRNFNDWSLSHRPDGPFRCRNDNWVLVGCPNYTLHSWKVENERLLWWKNEEIPVSEKENETRQSLDWHGDASAPAPENAAAVYATTMYFPGGGSSHPSRKIMEDMKKKEIGCLYYDASGHETALLVYRNGNLDKKHSWFLQPRMDARAVAEKEKKAGSDEERHQIKYLYRFAPYAERAEGQKTGGSASPEAGGAPVH